MRRRKSADPTGGAEQVSANGPGGEVAPEDVPEWAIEGARLMQALEEAYEQGRMDEVERLMEQVESFSEEHAGEMDSPQSPFLMESLRLQVEGDWDGAERALDQALEAADDPVSRWYANNEIVALYRTLDRDEDAVAAARRAVESLRGEEAPVLLYHALDLLATCAVAAEQPKVAMEAIAEALALGEGNADPYLIAGTLAIRARAHLHSGDTDQAKADLIEAWDLLGTTDVSALPPSAQPALFRCFVTDAHLCAAREDVDGALEARWAAFECINVIADNPLTAGMSLWKTVADACKALGEAQAMAGDRREAKKTLDEARALYRELNLPLPH